MENRIRKGEDYNGRAINNPSVWGSPFEGMTEGNPVIAAAEALWAVHHEDQKRTGDELEGGLGSATHHPDYGLDEIYDGLIERKDALLEDLASDREREQAFMYARLAIGHVEDPDLPENLSAMQEDLMDGVEGIINQKKEGE